MSLREHTLLQNGKYRIMAVIGQGGFGITYKAETFEIVQKALGEMRISAIVAIKELFLKNTCFRNEESQRVSVYQDKEELFINFKKKLLERESLLVSRLRNPHIVTVLDAFEDNNTAYLVMEYINGVDLYKILDQKKPLPVDRCLHLARQIAEALKAAHQKGVIHMDIKPANILIAPGDHVKLIDFGIAKQYATASMQSQVKTTVIGYSPYFSPPEQCVSQSRETFTPATDIYAFAGTLYQCLTGVFPFEVPARIMDDMPTVHDLNPNVPEGISQVISKAMELKRDDRYQTVEAFMEALDKVTLSAVSQPIPLPQAPLQPSDNKKEAATNVYTEERTSPQPSLPQTPPTPSKPPKPAKTPKPAKPPKAPKPEKPPKPPKPPKAPKPAKPPKTPKPPKPPKAPKPPKPYKPYRVKISTPSKLKPFLTGFILCILVAGVGLFILFQLTGKKEPSQPDIIIDSLRDAMIQDSLMNLNAFNETYNKAEELFKQGKYAAAEKEFITAKELPGCPPQNNIDAKIKECQQRLADELKKQQQLADEQKKQQQIADEQKKQQQIADEQKRQQQARDEAAAEAARQLKAAEAAKEARLELYDNSFAKNLGSNYTVVQRKSDKKWGIIDKEGNERSPFTYTQSSALLKNGCYALRNEQGGWDVFDPSLNKVASGITDLNSYR